MRVQVHTSDSKDFISSSISSSQSKNPESSNDKTSSIVLVMLA